MARSSKSQKLTLALALTTFATNTVSLILLAQSYDEVKDPFGLTQSYGWYLHVSSIFSLFGFIGAIRQDALTLQIFSNFLLGDSILSNLTRIILLNGVPDFKISDTICLKSEQTPLNSRSEDGCTKIVTSSQVLLTVACVVVTGVQFFGALACKRYATELREVEEERRVLVVEEGLEEGVLIDFEEVEEVDGFKD